jgi:uncharacterized protein
MTIMNASTLYEPLWQLEIALTSVEQSILHSFPLQRLHFISHMGAARFGTPMVHSRLQHTLGVFALVAHYEPQHTLARLAALLHDIGHAPFSHALELLPGVNHHRMTETLLDKSPLDKLLEDVYKHELTKLIRGETQSVLKDKQNSVNADNLDSWVRGGTSLGIQFDAPQQLLKKFALRDGFLETDTDTAVTFARLIIEAAKGQLEPLDLAANALLSNLVGELIDEGALTIEQLPHMIDAELTNLLLHTPRTKERARVLLFEPYSLRVRPLKKGESTEGEISVQPYLYLAMPRVNGVSILAHHPELQAEVSACQALAGQYLAWIDRGR